MIKFNSPFLKVSEVAKRLGVNKITVYRWLKSGKLRYFRIGGYTIRIKEKDLNEFIERRKNENQEKT